MSEESKKIFYITPIIWLVGFASLLFTIFLSSIITSIFNWPNILYNYFKFFPSSDVEIKANVFITVILIWFILSYFVYLFFVRILMKISLTFQRLYGEINLKRLVSILTIIIAYLGFLPLFLTFILNEQIVINSISNFYILIFMGLILPYTDFILQESKLTDNNKNIKQEEKDVVMKDNVYKLKSLKLHFAYTAIILILITCLVGGLSLYRQDLAIEGLSNASLLLSIVLAILAILITLWDVAGQRDSLIKVEKSVEDLRQLTDGLESLVTKSLEAIESKQGELAVVTNILLEKTESFKGNGEIDEIKNQLSIIQKGLNKSKQLTDEEINNIILRQLNSKNNNSDVIYKYNNEMFKFLNRKDI